MAPRMGLKGVPVSIEIIGWEWELLVEGPRWGGEGGGGCYLKGRLGIDIQVYTHCSSLTVLCALQVFQLQILVTFGQNRSCLGMLKVKVLPVPSSLISFL